MSPLEWDCNLKHYSYSHKRKYITVNKKNIQYIRLEITIRSRYKSRHGSNEEAGNTKFDTFMKQILLVVTGNLGCG